MADSDSDGGNYFKQRWMEAHNLCKTRLNNKDQHYIDTIKDCDAFKKSIEEMHITFQALSKPAIISQLDTALSPLRSFLTLLAVAAGGTPLTATIIWGILSLVIKLASDIEVVLTDTTEMLSGLGHDLEILQILETSFEQDRKMEEDLVDIFVDIIGFWTQAIHFLRRRRRLRYEMLSQWREVKHDFEIHSKRIRDRSNKLKEKADAIASARSASRVAVRLQRLDSFDTTQSGFAPIFTSSEPDSNINTESLHCHNIPYFPRSTFYGRNEELSAVRSGLSHSDEKMVSFVLWGIGGIGKTQIAAQYAHKSYTSGTQAVLWVNCATGVSISNSFKGIVKLLPLSVAPSDDNSDQNRLRVLQWLSKTDQSWLLVLDNVEDSKLANDCWPMAYHGSILVTTRRNAVAVALQANNLQVFHFSQTDGAAILEQRVRRSSYSKEEKQAAMELAAEVDGHALALTIIGAQVALRQKSFTKFLKLYRGNQERFHSDPRGIPSEYDGSLSACWGTAFTALNDDARSILGMLSLIAPDDIPEVLFGPRDLSGVSDKMSFFSDEMDLEDAFQILFDTSLINKQREAHTLHVHRLVQYEFKTVMGEPLFRDCFHAVTKVLYDAFPKQVNGSSLWPEAKKCSQFVPHVLLLCSNWQVTVKELFDGRSSNFTKLLTNVGWFLYETGGWSEVIDLMGVAFESCEDKTSIEYAHLCNTWGCFQIERGNPEDALLYLKKSLTIRSRELGEDHEETANTWNNLGNNVLQIYDSEVAPAEAIRCWTKALDIYNKAPEEERAGLAFASLLNITRAYRLMGDIEKASEYMDLTDAAIQSAFPAGGHWDATARVHRAHILYKQGNVAAAEELWRQAHSIFVSNNPTHPATASATLNLARIEMRRGECDIAMCGRPFTLQLLRLSQETDTNSSGSAKLQHLRLISELREDVKGDKGEIARVVRALAEAYDLKGDHERGRQLTFEAETMRQTVQKKRRWQLPDEERSYDMLVYNEYW